MKKLNKAILIATKVHKGYKGGKSEPAIFHPIRVMLQMDDNLSRIVAILHDVVETGKMSIDDLSQLGFSNKVCNTVNLLSRKKGESYNNYIKRVMTDKLAIKIKLADLKDNYRSKKNKLKLSKLDKSKIKEYKKAYKKLTGQKLTI